MLKNTREIIRRHHLNYRGWSTEKKLVVIESDDWGSIRMPSKEVFNRLLIKGFPVDKNPYCLYDTLAGEEDLTALFETLKAFSDRSGNAPVFTANSLVANPDFERIRNSGFENYYFEPFTQTVTRYRQCERSPELWKQGIAEKVFLPQFHGREHLNVPRWMKLLKENHPSVRYAFSQSCWGVPYGEKNGIDRNLQANFDSSNVEELRAMEAAAIEGLNLFEELYGYRSESFIAGNYIWSPALHETLQKEGVRFIQGMKYQLLPKESRNSKRKKIRHFTGQKNRSGQTFMVRNCLFEPSLYPGQSDPIGDCLKDIRNAFFWKKPAVIATHRLNYIGTLNERNRTVNLGLLRELIGRILSTWPDAEFVSSDSLGRLINSESLSV